MPKEPTAPPLSIEEALKKFGHGSARQSEAMEFLRTHFHLLKTEGQFMKAYAGLTACMLILGPISDQYRRTLMDMKGILESQLKARSQIVPDEWISLVQGTWQQAMEKIQTQLPPEVWNAIGDLYKGLFIKLR